MRINVGNDPGGFIEASEADFYEQTVRRHFRGEGCIVDAGCFIGASTNALIRGLDTHNQQRELEPPIIAIDRFTASDHYVAEYLAGIGVDVRFGESFLPVFLRNLGQHTPRVEVRAGDLIQVGRVDRAIELAVIDLAKTPALNAFVLQRWLPKMVPGHSLLIQQDFYSPTQPWIAHSMSGLLDYVSLEHDKVGESAVFRLERPIPANVLRGATFGWDQRDALSRLDRMIEFVGIRAAAPLRLMRALAFHGLGDNAKARSLLEQELAQPKAPQDQKWEKWLSAAVVAVMPDVFQFNAVLGQLYWRHGAQRLGHA
jgi:hypothetical protein